MIENIENINTGMPKLTLSMIVKNEEKKLEKCLSSVYGIADEIVVVDTGSTDSTKIIAEKFGAKVFDYEWCSDFAAARNFALEKSSGSWILYLDADEWLDETSREELKKIVNENYSAGIKCTVKNFDDYSQMPVFMRYSRLFKNNPDINFEGKVHEQIDNSLIKNNYKFYDSDIVINHDGYNLPKEELKIKADRNLKILFEEYGRTEDSYFAYQIANSLIILDERDSAAEYFLAALKDEQLPMEYKIIALTNLAGYELENLNFPLAKTYIENGNLFDPADPNFYLTAAQISLKLNLYEEVFHYLQKAYSFNHAENTVREKNELIKIKISNYKICYLGIMAAIFSGRAEQFQFFGKILDLTNSEKNHFSLLKESEVIKKLLDCENFNSTLSTSVSFYLKKSSLEIYSTLLQNHPDQKSVILILEKHSDNYSENDEFLLCLGNAYAEVNNLILAEKNITKALNLNPANPSIYFYLISLYIKMNQFDSGYNLLLKAKSQFKNSNEVMEKIADIEGRIKCLISA